MKLSSVARGLQQLYRAYQEDQRAQLRAQARPRAAANSDGFAAYRRPQVDLGRAPPASAAQDRAYVTGLYRDLLGRAPDEAGLRSHLRGLENGMSREEIRQVFLSSPEYRARQAAQGASPAPSAGQPVGVGPVPLEGYDAAKLHNLEHRTPKYLFGRVASHHPLDGVKSKEDAQRLLERMRPELEAAGLKVHEVQGDKIRVETELGQEWVDVVRGAGSGNPGWWWGSEGKAIPGTSPSQPGPSQPGPTVPGPTGPAPTEPGAPLSTVPMRPEYANATVDTSSFAAAAKSAAQWVKDTYPELMARAADRQVDFEIMTHVIGALRAHGYDAHRVVNHPSKAVGDGWRYGSDAVVLGGRIWDVFGGMGESNTPQAMDAGPNPPGRPRE